MSRQKGLQPNLLVKLEVLSLINLAHASASDISNDPEAIRHKILFGKDRLLRLNPKEARYIGHAVEEPTRRIVCFQEAFDFDAKRCVRSTLFPQESRALRRSQLDSRFESFSNSLPPLGCHCSHENLIRMPTTPFRISIVFLEFAQRCPTSERFPVP